MFKSNKNKIIAIAIIAGVAAVITFTASSGNNSGNQPPQLSQSKAIFQGLASDEAKNFGFITYEDKDKPLFETRKNEHETNKIPKSIIKNDATNKGVHLVHFSANTNFEEIVKNTDPSAKTIFLALYDTKSGKFITTSHKFYDTKATDIRALDKIKDVPVTAGQAVFMVLGGDTVSYNALLSDVKSSADPKICETAVRGWNLFVLNSNNPEIALKNCLADIDYIFVKTGKGANDFTEVKAADLSKITLSHYPMWIKASKDLKAGTGSTAGIDKPVITATSGTNNNGSIALVYIKSTKPIK